MQASSTQPPSATQPAQAETPPAIDIDCNVVELRQYTLRPGQRDVLIELFDLAFVEPQEAVGMAVMGQFRGLDAPDRFVWLRGFASMDSRAQGLTAFYDGPVWRRHRDAANATMIDSDNVLLLRPAWPGAGIPMGGRKRPTGPVRTSLPGVLDVSVFHLHEPASAALLRFCQGSMTQALLRGGAEVLGWYVTENAPNNFPRLPVRQGEHVLVGFAMFAAPAAFETFARSGLWAREVQPALEPWLTGPTQNMRLVATARSLIHG